MEQPRMRVGVIGANGGADRWGTRAHLPANPKSLDITLAAPPMHWVEWIVPADGTVPHKSSAQ